MSGLQFFGGFCSVLFFSLMESLKENYYLLVDEEDLILWCMKTERVGRNLKIYKNGFSGIKWEIFEFNFWLFYTKLTFEDMSCATPSVVLKQ